MSPGFEPQTDIRTAIVPFDVFLTTTQPESLELTLLAVPNGVNARYELVSISVLMHTLPADAGNNVDVVIEHYDATVLQTPDLVTTYALDTTPTALTVDELFRGSVILEAGDAINAEFDVSTPTTAGQGCSFIVEYRVQQHS